MAANPFRKIIRRSARLAAFDAARAGALVHESDAFSSQFDLIKREGHRRPPPVFGAPTLVWHVGVWPSLTNDPQHAEITVDFGPIGNGRNARSLFDEAVAQQRERQKRFIDLLNEVVASLQARGRASRKRESFNWVDDHGTNSTSAIYDQSVGFTLWWGDDGPIAGRDPGRDALRVRVHVEANTDFYTCSFFVDAGKPWGTTPVYGAADPGFTGARRARIFSAISAARSLAERRLSGDAVDMDLAPEAGVSPAEARDLLKAADYLYEGLWSEFQRDFDVDRTFISTSAGEIFADFRGLVIATAEDAPTPQAAASKGFDRYARFDNGENGARNEANAALKAWWPFIRRITQNADYREFVASTVMGRRAIYVTSLGASDEFDERDEAAGVEFDAPAGHLPDRADARAPIRYLFLSKGEPNRRQIGRMVERINNVGTLRLFALKEIAAVRSASEIIRMRGQHLDEVTNAWSIARREILKSSEVARSGRPKDQRSRERRRNEQLTRLTDEVEGHLIEINAHLDSIGESAAGALPFVIARSQKYVRQFYELVELLQPENIETWVSYDQFIQRGLRPTFNFIEGVGQRLKALRSRLQATMEAVQTSAVSIQTAATRHNTDTLSDLAISNKRTGWAVTALTIVLTVLNIDKLPAWLTSLWPGG